MKEYIKQKPFDLLNVSLKMHPFSCFSHFTKLLTMNMNMHENYAFNKKNKHRIISNTYLAHKA